MYGCTVWLQAHTGWTTVWFLGLITLVSSGQGAPSSTALSGRVQVGARQTSSGAAWQWQLLSCSALSAPPPFTPPLVLSPMLQSSLS